MKNELNLSRYMLRGHGVAANEEAVSIEGPAADDVPAVAGAAATRPCY